MRLRGGRSVGVTAAAPTNGYVVAVAEGPGWFGRWRHDLAQLLRGHPIEARPEEAVAMESAMLALTRAAGADERIQVHATQILARGEGLGRCVTAVITARIEKATDHQGGVLSTGL